MALTFPNESPEYRAARERLLTLEIDARRADEAAAKARRALPPGGEVPEDYVFKGPGDVRLSELVGDGKPLVVYSYMFGPERDRPCPMCTPLLDGLNGVGPHLAQRVTFVVVAESPFDRLEAWMRERGWKNLRLLSAAGNGYNRAYHGKTADGSDTTMINVFHRMAGKVRHFWGSELTHGPADPGEDHRGCDTVNPIFAMFDLTPEGRGDFYTQLSY